MRGLKGRGFDVFDGFSRIYLPTTRTDKSVKRKHQKSDFRIRNQKSEIEDFAKNPKSILWHVC